MGEKRSPGCEISSMGPIGKQERSKSVGKKEFPFSSLEKTRSSCHGGTSLLLQREKKKYEQEVGRLSIPKGLTEKTVKKRGANDVRKMGPLTEGRPNYPATSGLSGGGGGGGKTGRNHRRLTKRRKSRTDAQKVWRPSIWKGSTHISSAPAGGGKTNPMGKGEVAIYSFMKRKKKKGPHHKLSPGDQKKGNISYRSAGRRPTTPGVKGKEQPAIRRQEGTIPNQRKRKESIFLTKNTYEKRATTMCRGEGGGDKLF